MKPWGKWNPGMEGGQAAPSRRALLAGAGAGAVLASTAAFWPSRNRPAPSPIRRATSGPPRPPTTYFTDPDVLTVDPAFDGLRGPEQRHPPPLDRRALGGGAGLERGRPLPGLERHPQQPPVALAGGGRPRLASSARRQQQFQRQHLRLPGPPALLRARSPAASCATSSTARPRCWPTPSRASRSTRPTTSCQHPDGIVLVHRSALWRPALRGRAGRGGRPVEPAGRINPRLGQPAGIGAQAARLPTRVYRIDPTGRIDQVADRGRRCPIRTALLLARLQDALRLPPPARAGRHGCRRQGRDLRLRCRGRTTSSRTSGCSRIAWWTA